MTRETKIGLLVGLAFIIVIGILLSDQLMRSTEPQAAPLGAVADNLRKSTVTPASQARPIPPVTAAADASPDVTVPTRDEITRRPAPVTFVEIRPGDGGHTAINSAGQPVVIGVGGVQNGAGNYGNNNALVPNGNGGGAVVQPQGQIPPGGRVQNLAEVAAGMGETLIGPDGLPLRAAQPPNTPPSSPNNVGNRVMQPPTAGGNNGAVAANGMKQYTVQPGDNLGRIASRAMGANTKANRDAIVKANPSLAANPDKVVIGVTYNIPAAPAATPNVIPGTQIPLAPLAPVAQTPKPAAARGENVYVVQPGDNLTRIAKEQMGDVGTIAAIKELNRETVKDWNVLPVGTKLRLPGKSVASAN